MGRIATLVVAAAVLITSVSALAERRPGRKRMVIKKDPQAETAGPRDEIAPPSSDQRYSGVSLQGGNPPPTKAPPTGLVSVTWPGFRASQRGSGSEVFLQLSGSTSYKVQVKGRHLRITLDKAVVPLRNNLRRVITRNFPGTPVSQFRLRLVGADRVQLDIELWRKTQHTVAVNTQGQYSFLVVSFPLATSRKATPAAEE